MNRRTFVKRLLGAGATLMVPATALTNTAYLFPGLWARHRLTADTFSLSADELRATIAQAVGIPLCYLVPPGGIFDNRISVTVVPLTGAITCASRPLW